MDDFSTRLEQLLEHLHVKPVELAEKMGVQRTSFNHLLSGRNKPGFEFMVRLHACYPNVNLNWLVSGYGPMTDIEDHKFSETEKYESESQSGVDLFSNIFNSSKTGTDTFPLIEKEIEGPAGSNVTANGSHSGDTEIDRLIIVYKSGKMVEVKQ
jgi:hypothetical protein